MSWICFHIVRAETVLHVWFVASEKTNYIVKLKANQIRGSERQHWRKIKIKV